MEGSSPSERLDSWKAIADYLRRDVATARRWEKTLGLPVRRAGGRGHSVFAFTSEIDAWLAEKREPPHLSRFARHRWLTAFGIVGTLLSVGWVAARLYSERSSTDLRIELTPESATAFDREGHQAWRYAFPLEYRVALSPTSGSRQVLGGADPAVLVAQAHRVRTRDGLIDGGMLLWLDPRGSLRRTFSFDDEVRFGGKTFGPPWVVTDFDASDQPGTRRVAVSAHHFTWNPGLVTVLDQSWRRLGTFAHDGWIESVRWTTPNRLLIAGYSNAHRGGMLALLDADHLDGQGPEPPAAPSYCENCGAAAPVRMVIMPRSEINEATASPFNHALIQPSRDRVVARTIEIPSGGAEAVDAIYEFTPALELITASFSDRYWEVHRALEAQGKLDHPRDRCQERRGPLAIEVWQPGLGWRTQRGSGPSR